MQKNVKIRELGVKYGEDELTSNIAYYLGGYRNGKFRLQLGRCDFRCRHVLVSRRGCYMQTKLKKWFVVCIFILIIAVAISCTQKNENENSGAENSEKVSQEVSSSETTEIEDLLIQTDTALDVINSETLYAFSNLSLDDDGTEDDYAEVIHFSWSGEKSDSLVVVRFVLATGETLLQLYPVEENEIEVDCFPAKVIENDKEAMILQLRPGSSKESMVSILGLGISDGKKTV